MFSRLHTAGLSACVSTLVMGLCAVPRAQADTYVIEHIGNGNYQTPVAVDDYGDYTINISADPTTPAACGGNMYNGKGCYETYFTDGSTYIGTTPAALRNDPDPIAGAGCAAAAGPETLISCVNGHPIYSVESPNSQGYSRGLYDGTSISDYIPMSAIYSGFGVESANGNFVYLDALQEYDNLALDLTTAPTPEPSSIALLGSGLLTAAFGLRRRLA